MGGELPEARGRRRRYAAAAPGNRNALSTTGRLPINTRLNTFRRWLVRATVAAVLITMAAYIYITQRIHEEVRLAVEQHLAEKFPHLVVRVHRARITEGEGIRVTGVTLRLPDVAGSAGEVAYIDEMNVACDVSWQQLLSGKPDMQGFIMYRPRLRLVRLRDGTWNIDRLLANPTNEPIEHFVDGRWENATIEIMDMVKSPPSLYTVRDLNLTVRRAPLPAETYPIQSPSETAPPPATMAVATASDIPQASLASATSPASAGTAHLAARPPTFSTQPQDGAAQLASSSPPHAVPPPGNVPAGTSAPRPSRHRADGAGGENGPLIIEFYGHSLGDHLRRADLRGAIDLRHGRWSLTANVAGLDISPELHAALPACVCQQIGDLPLRAKSSARVRLAYDPQRAQPWKFQADVTISDGRIDDRRLPYPLSDLKAKMRISDQQLVIEELSASYQQTSLAASLVRHGWQPDSPCEISVKGHQVLLDPKLAQTVPDLAEVWGWLLPTGEVDIDANLRFDGRLWHPQVTITALDCSFAYDEFPYRFQRTTGTIAIDGERWSLNLTAHAGPTPVRLQGSLYGFGADAVGWVEAVGHPLHVDQELIAAIPDEARQIVSAFQPSGQVSVYARFWRDSIDDIFHHHLRIGVLRASFTHRAIPYRIENVQGVIEGMDDRWEFRDLVGTNDTGVVSGHGTVVPTPQGQELTLYLQGDSIPLDEELCDALPASASRVWREIRPKGAVHFRAVLRSLPGDPKPRLWMRVEPAPNSVSLEPMAFPLRLEKVSGSVVYDGHEVVIESLHAENGNLIVTTRGHWRPTPDGSSELVLRDFSADRVRFNRDLLKALPEQLRHALTQLNPTGALNVHGTLGFTRGAQSAAPLNADWDLNFNFHGNSLQSAVHLENLFGALRLKGSYRDGSLRCQGAINLDNLQFNGLQLTEVRGPLWLHDAGLWIGSPTARQIDPTQFEHLTARLYGGVVYLDGWVEPRPDMMRFALRTDLRDIDLRQFGQEAVSGVSEFSGRISAQARISGTSEGVRSLRGDGTVQLRDADIYELPQMVSLLKVLRMKKPNNTAFTQSDVSFHIEGDHVYLNRIMFEGDAVSLEGQGELSFNREIRLAFRATVAQGERWLPVFREMLKGAAQQFVEIRVEGTLDQPEFRNEPFPGVGKALKQLQDSARPSPSMPSDARRGLHRRR